MRPELERLWRCRIAGIRSAGAAACRRKGIRNCLGTIADKGLATGPASRCRHVAPALLLC